MKKNDYTLFLYDILENYTTTLYHIMYLAYEVHVYSIISSIINSYNLKHHRLLNYNSFTVRYIIYVYIIYQTNLHYYEIIAN